jgi:microcystin-dependent protein
MSTYSTNLKLELITTGTQAGTWGDTTNTNLGTLLEQAISGYELQACTGGTDVITIPDGATGVARNMYLQLTGTGGGTLVVPVNKKLYFIYNATSTAITVKVTGLTGVSVPAGRKTILVSNGTDIFDAINYASSLTLGAALPVASGGTGVTTSTGSGAVVLGTSPTIASPALTGTPTAPTASVGTNTTQIATTAFVTAGLVAAYPIGSIYMSTVATNPGTLFGFGTWVAYGTGRMPISADGSTYVAGTTGGSATTTLITANLPSHNHTATTTITDPGHTHTLAFSAGSTMTGLGSTGPSGWQGANTGVNYITVSGTNSSSTGITASTTTANTGSGTAATTISPYIAVYMWNRTA